MEAKPTRINCRGCGRAVQVRQPDIDAGSVTCQHKGCPNPVNSLFREEYNSAILDGLPGFGTLVFVKNPARQYALRAGLNVIGVSETATICLDREQYTHEGLCHISRRHCTLTVEFNSRTGQLTYFIQDGAITPETGAIKKSLNGTTLNGIPLKEGEIMGISEKTLLVLGELDAFRIVPYQIPAAMLQTYKKPVFNPGGTT
jgi:hypothetical protein